MLYTFRNREDKKAYKRALALIEEKKNSSKKKYGDSLYDEEFHENYIAKKNTSKNVRENQIPESKQKPVSKSVTATPAYDFGIKKSGVRKASTEVVDMSSYVKPQDNVQSQGSGFDSKNSISNVSRDFNRPTFGNSNVSTNPFSSSVQRASASMPKRESVFPASGRPNTSSSPFDMPNLNGSSVFDSKPISKPTQSVSSSTLPKKNDSDDEPKKHFMISESGSEDDVETKKSSSMFDIDRYLDEQLKLLSDRRKQREIEGKRYEANHPGESSHGELITNREPENPIGEIHSINFDEPQFVDNSIKDVWGLDEFRKSLLDNELTKTEVKSENKVNVKPQLASFGNKSSENLQNNTIKRVVVPIDKVPVKRTVIKNNFSPMSHIITTNSKINIDKTTNVMSKTDNIKDGKKVAVSQSAKVKEKQPEVAGKDIVKKIKIAEIKSETTKKKKKRIDSDLL